MNMRIKGWVSKKTIHPFCRNHSSMVYMEEIPKTAIRLDAVPENYVDEFGGEWLGLKISFGDAYKGKKVSIIIIPEEG